MITLDDLSNNELMLILDAAKSRAETLIAMAKAKKIEPDAEYQQVDRLVAHLFYLNRKKEFYGIVTRKQDDTDKKSDFSHDEVQLIIKILASNVRSFERLSTDPVAAIGPEGLRISQQQREQYASKATKLRALTEKLFQAMNQK